MDQIKYYLKKKRIWAGLIIVFSINEAVNANKEVQQDLLNQYYHIHPSDTIKKGSFIVEEAPSKADSLITYARTLLGRGYAYGKTGPNEFDCSGYISHIYTKFNITVPRSSKAQSKYGEPLKREEVQKGDLLFFKSPSPNNPNVGHVGIALSNINGSIKFIHSSTNRGVVIDSLGSRHYGRRFMEARRVILN